MVSGWIVKPLRSADGERRLVVAAVLQALQDARRGDVEAWVWLDTTGRQWCEMLGIDGVDDWQTAAGRVEACRRELADDRTEYWARYHERNKDDPAYQERQRAKRARYQVKRKARAQTAEP